MADQARLQVRTVADPEKWENVGAGTAGVPVPTTVESSALPLWQGLLLGNKSSVGDIDHSDNEFALKNNTSYNFRVTSGAASNKVLIRFVWYEDLGV